MPSEMPGVKRQMLCDSTYLRYFRVVKVIKTGIVIVVAWESTGEGRMEVIVFNRYGVSVSLDERVMESSYGYR